MVQINEDCTANNDTDCITVKDKQKVIENSVVEPITNTNTNTDEIKPPVSDEDFEKAQKLFMQGKKNLILNKYNDAVNDLGDACKTYSAKYGELSSECADIYFYYGKALLELARVETTVLGNALSGVPEETEPIDDSRYGNPDTVPEEEREEIAEKVIDAMCDVDGEAKKSEEEKIDVDEKKDEQAAEKKEEDKPKEEEKKEEVKEVAEEKAVEEEPKKVESEAKVEEEKKVEEENGNGEAKKEEKPEATAAAAEKVDCEEQGEKGDENEEDIEGDEGKEDGEEGEDVAGEENEEEDVSNLQQSWEMFELAKLIYTKHYEEKTADDKFFKLKRICECLLKLGEISIEQELYDQAINDINESIKIQETQICGDDIEKRDERLLAESYYQLALAHQFQNKCDIAKELHNKSINILNIRIEKLKGKLTKFEESADAENPEKKEILDEISEIEALIPEMSIKLEELNEQEQQEQQTLKVVKETAKECFLSTFASSNGENNGTGSVSSSDQVKDITNSIKSKRKLDSSTDNTELKKVKTDSSESNGDAAAVAVDAVAPANGNTETIDAQ